MVYPAHKENPVQEVPMVMMVYQDCQVWYIPTHIDRYFFLFFFLGYDSLRKLDFSPAFSISVFIFSSWNILCFMLLLLTVLLIGACQLGNLIYACLSTHIHLEKEC